MPSLTSMLCGYLVLINCVGFISMAVDKYKAQHGRWRISEFTLMVIAVIGGSMGSLLGMLCLRHKTQHVKFLVGVPLVFALQLALALYLI